MKTMPGSPEAQADSTSMSKISFAFRVPVTSLLRGFTRSKEPLVSTAFMNFSSRAMDRLKFSSTPGSDLSFMNSLISGCQ